MCPDSIHADAAPQVAPTHAGEDSGALDRARIRHLIDDVAVTDATVAVVGLGSGGFPVMQQLAMSGVRRWHLFDPDRLESHNLVKHPALRAELGQPKTAIAEAWLKDRNPQAVVYAHAEASTASAAIEPAVQDADLVVVAVDNRGAREQLNELAIRYATPMVVGQVYRGGFGGEVYAFVPGRTACHACLGDLCQRQGWIHDPDTGPDAEEQRQRYGLGNHDFSHSGLATDLGLVASLHASVSLSVLFGREGGSMPPLESNWLVFGTRPRAGVFGRSFQVRRLLLRAQRACALGCGACVTPQGPEAQLGVSPGASAAVVSAAWRTLQRQLHPDRFGSEPERSRAHQRYVAAQQAHNVLIERQREPS